MRGYMFQYQDLWMKVDAEELGVCEAPVFSAVLSKLHDAQQLTQAITVCACLCVSVCLCLCVCVSVWVGLCGWIFVCVCVSLSVSMFVCQ